MQFDMANHFFDLLSAKLCFQTAFCLIVPLCVCAENDFSARRDSG